MGNGAGSAVHWAYVHHAPLPRKHVWWWVGQIKLGGPQTQQGLVDQGSRENTGKQGRKRGLSRSSQCDLGSTVEMKPQGFRGKEPHKAVLWMKEGAWTPRKCPLPGPTAEQVRLGGDHVGSVLQKPGKPRLLQKRTGSLPTSRERPSQANGWSF